MPDWLLWILAAGAFSVGEVMTSGFFLAPFAFGAALAAGADLAVGNAAAWTVFILVSVMTLALVRPLVRSRMLNSTPAIRTGGAALVGKRAVVLERIVNGEGVGCVRIDGEVWTARSLDDDEVIEAGTRVEVIDIRGATALVME